MTSKNNGGMQLRLRKPKLDVCLSASKLKGKKTHNDTCKSTSYQNSNASNDLKCEYHYNLPFVFVENFYA